MSKNFKKLLSFFTLTVFLVTNSTSSFAMNLFLARPEQSSLINSFTEKYQELALNDDLNFKCISAKSSSDTSNPINNSTKVDPLENSLFNLQVIQLNELGTSTEQSLSNYSLINNIDGKFIIPELTANNVYSNQYFLLTLNENIKDSISSLSIVKNEDNSTYYYQNLTKDNSYLLKDLLPSAGSYTLNISYEDKNSISTEKFTFQINTLANTNYDADEITNVNAYLNAEDNTLNLSWSEKIRSDKVDYNLYKPIKVLFKNLELVSSAFSQETSENALKFNASYDIKDKLQIGETYQGEIFTVDSLGNIVSKEFSFTYEDTSIPDVPQDEAAPTVSFLEISGSGSQTDFNSNILKINSFLGIKISDENIASNNDFIKNNIKELLLLKKDANGTYVKYSNYKASFDSSFAQDDLTTVILKLTDGEGNLLSDGNYKIIFSAVDNYINASNEAALEFTVFNNEITADDINLSLKYDDGSEVYYNHDKYYFNNSFLINLNSLDLPTNYSKASIKVYRTSAVGKKLIKTYQKKYSSASYSFIIDLADLNAANMDTFNILVETSTVRGDTISLPELTTVYDAECDNYNFTVNSPAIKLSETEYLSQEKKINFNVDFLEEMDSSTTKVLFSNDGTDYLELSSSNDSTNYTLDISQSSMDNPVLLKIIGTDLAQNPLAEKIYKFYYDGAAPEIKAVYNNELPIYNDSIVFFVPDNHSIKLKFAINTEVEAAENVFAISIADPNYSSYSYELTKDGQAYNGSLNNLSAGHYTLKVVAIDSLNNTSTSSFEFYVDDSAPIVEYKVFAKNNNNQYSLADLEDIASGCYTTNSDYYIGIYVKDTTLKNVRLNYKYDGCDESLANHPLIEASLVDGRIDEHLYIIDTSNVYVENIHEMTVTAADAIEGNETIDSLTLVIDNSTPVINDITFAGTDSSLVNFEESNNRVSVNGDFSASITLPETVSGYDDISFYLSSEDASFSQLKISYSWPMSDLTDTRTFTADFSLAQLHLTDYQNLKLKVVVKKGSGLSTEKYYDVFYDTKSPMLTLNESRDFATEDTEIINNHVYSYIPDISIKLNDDTCYIDSLNINNTESYNSLGIVSFKKMASYKSNDYVEIPDISLTAVNDTNTKFAFDYQFTTGIYEITIKAIDAIGNESMKTYNFSIDTLDSSLNLQCIFYSSSNEKIYLNDKYNSYFINDDFGAVVSFTDNIVGYSSLKFSLADHNNELINYTIPGINLRGDTDYTYNFSNLSSLLGDLSRYGTDLTLTISLSSNNPFCGTITKIATIHFDDEGSLISVVNNNQIINSDSLFTNNISPEIVLENSSLDLDNLSLNTNSDVSNSLSISDFNVTYLKNNNIANKDIEVELRRGNNGAIKIYDLTNNRFVDFNTGIYTFKLKAIDLCGNISTLEPNYHFSVETSIDDFSYSLEDTASNALPFINNIYYSKGSIIAKLSLPAAILGYSDVKASLTGNDYTHTGQLISVDDNSLNYTFKFEITDSKLLAADSTNLVLNFAASTPFGNNTAKNLNVIFDCHSPVSSMKLLGEESKDVPKGNDSSAVPAVTSITPVGFNPNALFTVLDANLADSELVYLGAANLNDETFTDLTSTAKLSLKSSDIFNLVTITNEPYSYNNSIYKAKIKNTDFCGNVSFETYYFVVDQKDVSGTASLVYRNAYSSSTTLVNINNVDKTVYLPYDGTLTLNIDSNISGFENSSLQVNHQPINNDPSLSFGDLLVSSSRISASGDISTDGNSKSCTLQFNKAGEYNISWSVKSRSKNKELNFKILVIVDHEEPTATISTEGTSYNNFDNVFYTKDANRQLKLLGSDRYDCQLSALKVNGVYYNEYTVNSIISNLIQADGVYNIYYEVVDNAGLKNSTTLNMVVDTIAPVITTSNSFNTVNGVNYTNEVRPYAYSADDINLLSDSITVNGLGYTKNSSIAGDGVKDIIITAEDKAGNITITTPFQFELDTIAPTITYSDVVDGKYYNTKVTPKIRYEDKNIDLSSYAAFLNDSSYNGSEISKDGEYKFTASIKDYAGNISNLSFGFIIDTIAPIITITGILENIVNGGAVNPIIKIDDASANVTSLLNGDEYYGSSIMETGKYILLVQAVDLAGNIAKKTVTFMLDATLPEIYVENIADGETYKPGLSPKISVTKNAEYTMLLNGKEYDGSKIKQEGEYTLEIKAKDSVGNENSLSITFTIAKEADKTVTTTGDSSSTSNTDNGNETDNAAVYKNAFTHNKLIFTIALTTIVLVVCGGSFVVYSYQKRKKKNSAQ